MSRTPTFQLDLTGQSEIPADRRLYISVIMQAISDLAPHTNVKGSHIGRSKDKAKAEAIAWFEAADEDFDEVCARAGVEPATLSRLYKSGHLRTIAPTIAKERSCARWT